MRVFISPDLWWWVERNTEILRYAQNDTTKRSVGLDVGNTVDGEAVVSCWQGGWLDGVACGKDSSPLARLVDGVHAVELLDIFHEDIDLEDFFERRAGGAEVLLEFIEHPLGVFFD